MSDKVISGALSSITTFFMEDVINDSQSQYRSPAKMTPGEQVQPNFPDSLARSYDMGAKIYPDKPMLHCRGGLPHDG